MNWKRFSLLWKPKHPFHLLPFMGLIMVSTAETVSLIIFLFLFSWDSGVGAFTFSDQFLQISTALPSFNLFGFGENQHQFFSHDMEFQTWPMFARNQPPSDKVYYKYQMASRLEKVQILIVCSCDVITIEGIATIEYSLVTVCFSVHKITRERIDFRS